MQAQGELTIERMCQLMNMSRAGYYRFWTEKEPREAEVHLRDAVQKAALAHRYYGYRRIAEVLRREGWVVGQKVIRRVMSEDNLLAIRKRKFVRTTDSKNEFRVYPNLAERCVLSDINQLWVADITYIRLQDEFVYLAVVLDAYSRKAIGWSLQKTLESRLALAALEKALAGRSPKPGWVHHSDRGTQYASDEYVRRLEAGGALLSMSRPARPWENGRCESFIKTLKMEEINARSYKNMKELENNINDFMETNYNRVRLHSALGYRSPEEYELALAARPLLALAEQSWLPAALSFFRHEEI